MNTGAPSVPNPSTPPTLEDNSIAFEVIDPLVAGLTPSPAAAPQPLTEAQKEKKYDLRPVTPIDALDIDLTDESTAPAQTTVPVTPPQPVKTQPVVDTRFSKPTAELEARLAVLEAREAEANVNKLNKDIKPTAEQPMPEVASPVQTADSAPALKENVTTKDGTPDGRLLRDIAEKFSPRHWKPSIQNADYTVDNLVGNSKINFARTLKDEGVKASLFLPLFAGQVTALALTGGLGTMATAVTAGAITAGGLSAAVLVLIPIVGTGIVGAVFARKMFKAWSDNRNLIKALKENNFKITPNDVSLATEERYTRADALKDGERIKKDAEVERARQAQTPDGPSDYSVTESIKAERARNGWRSLFQLGRH